MTSHDCMRCASEVLSAIQRGMVQLDVPVLRQRIGFHLNANVKREEDHLVQIPPSGLGLARFRKTSEIDTFLCATSFRMLPIFSAVEAEPMGMGSRSAQGLSKPAERVTA